MVRISIPTLPALKLPLPFNPLADYSPVKAATHLKSFLNQGQGKTLVMTGAGVSVESGIRAYRGSEGHYTTNPNYVPIYYSELVDTSAKGDQFRKRYWARSFLGYPPVRDALPNPTHIYVAALQALGIAPSLITQNVDNLHPKASRMFNSEKLPPILELHGTLAKVHCPLHRHQQPRDDYQAELSRANPSWEEFAREAERTGTQPRTNPDGDVDLRGVKYDSFVVPSCKICAKQGVKEKSVVKPDVVFFGETLSPETRDRSFEMISSASQVLVLGTSLATYSAFRLIKMAHEQKKPVLMISLGPSRADSLSGIEKMERPAGPVLRAYLDDFVKSQSGLQVELVRSLLDSGVVKAPTEIEGPRAEG